MRSDHPSRTRCGGLLLAPGVGLGMRRLRIVISQRVSLCTTKTIAGVVSTGRSTIPRLRGALQAKAPLRRLRHRGHRAPLRVARGVGRAAPRMFAFAVHGQVWACSARDRLGIKPLYYAEAPPPSIGQRAQELLAVLIPPRSTRSRSISSSRSCTSRRLGPSSGRSEKSCPATT